MAAYRTPIFILLGALLAFSSPIVVFGAARSLPTAAVRGGIHRIKAAVARAGWDEYVRLTSSRDEISD